jgi:metal-responsive CopG/Arc/MetJ family transcriptional regulator
MKTAISVPDDTFERATKRAGELGMSRSEFFSRAAERYLRELDRASTTEQINSVLASMTPDDHDEVVVAAGRRRLAETEW